MGDLLRRRGLSLGVAESCTAGLLGNKITSVPGASDYFLGGIIAYDNRVKVSLLSVQEETLVKFGAVSEQTALEMAQGVRRAVGCDVGVSITGIAGPGGGTPEKPVGLTWIAVSLSDAHKAWHSVWSGGRRAVKEQSAEEALRLLAGCLREL